MCVYDGQWLVTSYVFIDHVIVTHNIRLLILKLRSRLLIIMLFLYLSHIIKGNKVHILSICLVKFRAMIQAFEL
jgi:hypothetical protein